MVQRVEHVECYANRLCVSLEQILAQTEVEVLVRERPGNREPTAIVARSAEADRAANVDRVLPAKREKSAELEAHQVRKIRDEVGDHVMLLVVRRMLRNVVGIGERELVAESV